MRGIAVLLAMALGVGVGYLLGASTAPGTPARARTATGPATDLPPEVRPSGDNPLAQAIRELPLPPARRGNGVVTGRVTRPDGRPVAGVAIRGTLRERNEWRERADGPPPPPDIEEEVRRLVATLQSRQINQVEAVTDGDGRYALEGLADDTCYVSAYLAGFRVVAAGRSDAKPGDTVDFTATPVAAVTFEILLPDGTVAPDATVRLKAGNRTPGYGWRRDQPTILLEPGEYVCTAEHGESDEYRSPEVPLSLPEGAPAPPTLVIRLEGRPGIRGIVTFSKDLPFERASVHALAFPGEKQPDAKTLVAQGRQDGARSGSGAYGLLDLPRGRYLVGVACDRTILATRIVDVTDRLETCDFHIDAVEPSLLVVVRVLDPSGKPVTDVTFGTAYRTERSSHSSGGATAARRPDGSFLLLHQQHDQPEGGTYFVLANSPQYGEKEAAYRKGDPEVVLRFSEPATLDVTVTGFAGSEYAPNLTIALAPVTADESARFASRIGGKGADPEGRASFGPVENGEYHVMLAVQSTHARLHAAKHPVTLRPGRNAISIPMPRLHAVVVADPGGKQGQSLSMASETGESQSPVRAALDETLRARFAPLPEGTYQIRRDADSSGGMRVTVRGDAEITFRPTPYTAMRVRIPDPGSPAAKAGLMDGDLIVAVDGDEIESADELQLAYASLRVKEKASLGILRGGGRVEVAVRAKELFAAGAGGARVEWATR